MPRSSTVQIAFLAILLLATLLALQHHKSYTADEVYELRNLSTSLSELATSPDGFPPLYRWLLSLFIGLMDHSNARMFSALTAVVGLLFVASTGRLFSDAIGTRAALFYTVSACQLEYAQQVRAYSLYICFGAIVIWAAVNVIYHQRARDWIVLVLSSVATLWTHYYAALFLVCIWQGLLILVWRDNVRSLPLRRKFYLSYVLSMITSLILLIPWLYPLRMDLLNPPPKEAINAVDLTGIAYTYLTLIQGWCVGPSQLELFEWAKRDAILAIAPGALLSATLFATILYYACFHKTEPVAQGEHVTHETQRQKPDQATQESRVSVFAIWLTGIIIAFPLGSVVLAMFMNSSYVPRYMAVLVIPVSLVFGVGSQLSRPNWRMVASWGLIALNLVSFGGRSFSNRYDRENYRALMQFLKMHEEAPKLLVLSNYLGQAIEYQKDAAVQLAMVGLNSDEPDNWPEIQTALPGVFGTGQPIWLAADWMRPDDMRLTKRNKILNELGAKHVKRISGTIDVYLVASGILTVPP